MTLEEVYAYKAAYNRIISEQEAAISRGFTEKFGIPEEDIVYLGKHNYIIVNLTKERIYEADTYSEIASLDYAGDAVVESPSVTTNMPPTESLDLYKDKVLEIEPFIFDYSELYYHRDVNDEIDWVLITGDEPAKIVEPLYQVIGNRVLIGEFCRLPFETGFAVYDVKQNIIKTLFSSLLEQYDGLEEAFNEYGGGHLLGDLDGDDEISIVDATIIQRCEAELCDYPDNDNIVLYQPVEGALKYYSDFNRDGERDITDVTAIQRYIANMPYLVGK